MYLLYITEASILTLLCSLYISPLLFISQFPQVNTVLCVCIHIQLSQFSSFSGTALVHYDKSVTFITPHVTCLRLQ